LNVFFSLDLIIEYTCCNIVTTASHEWVTTQGNKYINATNLNEYIKENL
jgi:hypothetical protein